jgi:NCAIR mutase (PurE)-related protein
LLERSDKLLVTKVDDKCLDVVRQRIPDAVYQPIARAISVNRAKKKTSRRGRIMIITGGTADIPVAEEAALTAELMGNQVERSYDVGVAGVHRLLDHLPLLRKAKVVVAVAGMEGALPSVVSGLISAPVIAVPTSVGYGASFGGVAALLTMLNSCSAGVSVVNIDNGFGAGYLASLIAG